MNLESLFNSAEIAEMRELARREAEAEIAAENEKLVKETAKKMLMAAYKAQAIAELRAKNGIDIEKTAYDLIASSNPEIAKFINIAAKTEQNIKKLASAGLSISKKDNQTLVNSAQKQILENLGYSDSEVREILNKMAQESFTDEEYHAIKDFAAQYFADKYENDEEKKKNLITIDSNGNIINMDMMVNF